MYFGNGVFSPTTKTPYYTTGSIDGKNSLEFIDISYNSLNNIFNKMCGNLNNAAGNYMCNICSSPSLLPPAQEKCINNIKKIISNSNS